MNEMNERHSDPAPCTVLRTSLPADSALLLWAIRQLVVSWPCSGRVRAGLIARFGDNASGIEHLIRCLIAGMAIHGTRTLALGAPCCATVHADERAILEAIGLDGAEPDPSALVQLCGSVRGECLAPLAAMISDLSRHGTF